MKAISLLTVGLLSAAVAADPNGQRKHRKHRGDECMELLHSQHIVTTSNDTNLMARLEKNYPKKATMIKSKKEEAQLKIKKIEGNSSHPADWLANCHVQGADMQLKHQCMQKDFLPKIQTKWNDKIKGAEIQKHHKWTDGQFTQEKEVLATKIKDLGNNQTLTDRCVNLPKDHMGEKGDGKDGKGGKDGKADGKGDKGAKAPDGKPGASQKGAASGLNGAEAVRGGAFALAFTLFMAVTIL